MTNDFIISPYDVCASCNGDSGPRFSLRPLRGISTAHRTNEILTGADLQSCLDVIRNAQLEIERLDTEILRLQQTVKVLKQRRVELPEFKVQELGLIAPIRSLPDDLLKKIFLICQQEFEVKPGYIQYTNPHTFVRTVTQVSNYWRNTALSMPSLWSCVSFQKHRKRITMPPGEFLGRCLKLSGSVPLSIEFASGVCTPDMLDTRSLFELGKSAHRRENLTVNDGLRGILELDALLLYVPKWTILRCLKTFGPIHASYPIILQSTPVLTHLIVQYTHSTATISVTSAPLLTNLTTNECSESRRIRDVLPSLPWSQITHYHCREYFNSGEFLELMNSMPNLVALTMDLSRENKLTTFMTLPKLEALTLESVTFGDPLKFFTTPSLKELNAYENCRPEMIHDLVIRSGCTVERLSVSGRTLLQGNWNTDPLKDVRRLSVNCATSGSLSRVMKFLTWNASSTIFPRVETLRLKAPGHFPYRIDSFPIEVLKALVISRLPSKLQRRNTDIPYIKSTTVTISRDLDKIQGGLINDFRTSEIIRKAKVDVAVIGEDDRSR